MSLSKSMHYIFEENKTIQWNISQGHKVDIESDVVSISINANILIDILLINNEFVHHFLKTALDWYCLD